MNQDLRKHKNAVKARLFTVKMKIDQLREEQKHLQTQLTALNKSTMNPTTLKQRPPVPSKAKATVKK